ncbi:Nucleic acid-binding, OB-fold, partial [Cynara cardunculus var. scolymus]
MWESLNNKKGGELISLDMILIDEEENLIHGSIWSSIVPKFKSLLHEGVLYEIKNFKVVPSDGNSRPLANDIKIIFQKFTSIKKLEEDIFSIPKNGFQFISANLVHSRVNDDTILSGIIYFATTSASKIFINLRINYVSSLIERFTTVANGVHFIENVDEKKRRDEDMLLERMIINDLLCATWDKGMKVPFIIVRGKITSVVSLLGWFYMGCKACYKQLTTINGGYFCENCKAEFEFPLVL